MVHNAHRGMRPPKQTSILGYLVERGSLKVLFQGESGAPRCLVGLPRESVAVWLLELLLRSAVLHSSLGRGNVQEKRVRSKIEQGVQRQALMTVCPPSILAMMMRELFLLHLHAFVEVAMVQIVAMVGAKALQEWHRW